MKYMTKEWYNTMQNSSLHLLLKVSKKAVVFSEKYYTKLYQKEETEWLGFQKEAIDTDIDIRILDEQEPDGESDDSLPKPDPAGKTAVCAPCVVIYTHPKDPESFDPEQEKRMFWETHRSKIKRLKTALPDKILQKVADIRVLALDRAAAGVKKEIAQYCRANEKMARNIHKAYWDAYSKAFQAGKPDFLDQFNFHDCKVVSCRKKGKDIVIKLENTGGFTCIDRIIFKNCTVITQDAPLHKAWWLYNEIYKVENGYEIHVLLANRKHKLLYFTVVTETVTF